MITLTAQIELLKSGTGNGDNGILSGVSLSPPTLSGNNASAEIGAVLGSKKTIKKPFVFGKSVLGGGDKYYGELDYFMGGQLSDKNGNFANTYTITINGTNINAITIAFDDLNGAYPKSIVVDGKSIADDDAFWTIGLNTSNNHTITISNWNKPNSPLIISGIYIDLTIEINRENIQSLESSIFDRADISLPSFGIISSTGRIDFIDVDGEVRDYAEQQILKSGLNVTISLNNTLTKASEITGTYLTTRYDYSIENRIVSINLEDNLTVLQDINTENIYLSDKTTLFDLFVHLKTLTLPYFEVVSSTAFDNYLTECKCGYPYLNADTLWNQWQKLCEACGAYMYKTRSSNQIRIFTDFEDTL